MSRAFGKERGKEVDGLGNFFLEGTTDSEGRKDGWVKLRGCMQGRKGKGQGNAVRRGLLETTQQRNRS